MYLFIYLLAGLRIWGFVLGESMSAHRVVIQSFMAGRSWHQELEELLKLNLYSGSTEVNLRVLISKIRVLYFFDMELFL